MKRTKIKYRDLGDEVEIVAIENAANTAEILEKFGKKVSDRYLDGGNWYHHIGFKDAEDYYFYFPGHMNQPGRMSKQEFGKFITTLKAAGKRLQRIVREEREKEIKEVVI